MEQHSIFASITGGTKFSRKRHQGNLDIFKSKDKAQEAKIGIFDSKKSSTEGKTVTSGKKNSEISYPSGTDDDGDDEEFENQEEINAFRNRLLIKAKGNSVPPPCSTFYCMDIHSSLKPAVIKNVEASDWKDPTPIQMQAIPCMLTGRDVLATAPTGSGKTAAFVIPVLSNVVKIASESKSISSNSRSGDRGSKKKKGASSKILVPPMVSSSKGVKAVLLAPTKELVEQIHREALRLSTGKRVKICILKKRTVSAAIAKSNKHGFDNFDILIATPLRLLTVLRSDAIDLSRVRMVVLDEADKLFELDSQSKANVSESVSGKTKKGKGGGIEERPGKRKRERQAASGEYDHYKEEDDDDGDDDDDDDDDKDEDGEEQANEDEQDDETAYRDRSSFLSQIDEILSHCTERNLQRALFSATIGPFVRELGESFLVDPVQVAIGKENSGATTIDQRLVFVGRENGKLLAVRQIVQKGLKPPVLLFVQSIDRAKELLRELIFDGINVDVMHADRTQLQREECIRRFRVGEIWVLICTDLMARGIDFKGVRMVINYDLPQSAVSYIHRIGRTGRAGLRGEAVTLFTEADIPCMRPIVNVMKLSGCEVPQWMLAIKTQSTRKKRQLRQKAPMRRHIEKKLPK